MYGSINDARGSQVDFLKDAVTARERRGGHGLEGVYGGLFVFVRGPRGKERDSPAADFVSVGRAMPALRLCCRCRLVKDEGKVRDRC